MDETSVSKRFDQKLSEDRPELSRSYIASLITSGYAKINGKKVTKLSQLVSEKDKLSLNVPIKSKLEQIEIPILYEDEDLIVINKPKGILSHSKGAHNPEATVATWLNQYLKRKTTDTREGIVHRLDRATSGVMVIAKNQETYIFLQKQFSQRKVKKTYISIVLGELLPKEALIELPIERNPKRPQSFRVGANGKSSQTSYKVLEYNGKYSLVELKPKTGRTHQLRVHLNYLKHPILGDDFYDGEEADRLYLHAHKLEITLRDGTRREFISEIPTSFNRKLNEK